MLVAGLIACAFGVLQAFLLKETLFSVTGGDTMKAVLFLLLKLFLYGVAAALLALFFLRYAVACAVGFSAGLPLAVSLWFVYQTLIRAKVKVRTGDGKNENRHDH